MGSKLLLKLLLRLLAPALVLALVVVLLVRLEIIENPVRFVAEELGIVSRTKTAGSTLLLEELRSIYRLNTMEYIYRTVFPFDYMPETTDYSEVMNTIRNSAVPAGEALTEDQRLYFDAANLAEDVGLEEEEFLVLTVRVFAGFDLENTSHGDGATTENASEAASRAM